MSGSAPFFSRHPEPVSLQVLLRHEVGAVFDAHFMNGCDVWAIQRGGSTRLLLEPSRALGIRGKLGGARP